MSKQRRISAVTHRSFARTLPLRMRGEQQGQGRTNVRTTIALVTRPVSATADRPRAIPSKTAIITIKVADAALVSTCLIWAVLDRSSAFFCAAYLENILLMRL